MTLEAAYLDSSAFVKLFVDERESDAFARELSRWPRLVTSELLPVEVMRVAQRQPQPAEAFQLASELLRGVGLRPLRRAILRRAARLAPGALGTLDALHLATALDLGARPAAFFTYDRRLAAAATRAGLPVLAPGT